MEPVSVVVAGGAAAAGWMLGRATAGGGPGAGPGPGDAIRRTGSQLSVRAGSGVASLGGRAVRASAAGVTVGGLLAARGLGAVADGTASTVRAVGRSAAGVTRLRPWGGSGPPPEPASPPVEDGLPTTETSASGLEVPVGTQR